LLEKEMHSASLSLSKLLKNDEELKRTLEEFKVASIDELFVNIGYGKIAAKAVIDFLAPTAVDAEAPSVPPSLKEGKIESFVRKITGRDNRASAERRRRHPRALHEVLQPAARRRDRRVHHARSRRHGAPAQLHEGLRRRPRSPRRDHVGRQGEDQPPGAGEGHDAEPPRHPRDDRADVPRAGHQHQRGAVSRRGRRPRDNVFTFLCSDLNQLKNVMRRLQKIPGVVSVERV
jgi:guanosine-3',5'-bis(diphosphate) 3'-pyrophosphohydrolase